MDPGNLGGALELGAYTGPQLLWVLWWATVMGLILQEMSARLGIVTGKDLAQVLRAPRRVGQPADDRARGQMAPEDAGGAKSPLSA